MRERQNSLARVDPWIEWTFHKKERLKISLEMLVLWKLLVTSLQKQVWKLFVLSLAWPIVNCPVIGRTAADNSSLLLPSTACGTQWMLQPGKMEQFSESEVNRSSSNPVSLQNCSIGPIGQKRIKFSRFWKSNSLKDVSLVKIIKIGNSYFKVFIFLICVWTSCCAPVAAEKLVHAATTCCCILHFPLLPAAHLWLSSTLHTNSHSEQHK